jgi:glycine/D-amino acid oxidase-like deaminating enzyme
VLRRGRGRRGADQGRAGTAGSDGPATALLAADYAEAVLWQQQADPPVLEPGPLPAQVDVAVVGAGYCGLSAARVLARAGRSVLVVERDQLGWGASTRNGGMAIPELKDGPSGLTARYGPVGRRLYDEVNQAFDQLEALVVEEELDCDYHRPGQLYLAHNRAHVDALAALADEHGGELGEPVRFVPRPQLGEEIGSDAFYAGVVLERTGGLHPARYHAGLARLALAAGAQVHDHTAAVAIEPRPRGGFQLVTDRGAVEAGEVLVATNAYADNLVPWLARRVVPIGSYIVATEVLDPDLARSVNPHQRMLVDTKNLLFYWRLSPDGRVLFGGRRSLATTTVAQARDFLYRSLVAIHPQLAGVRITHAWGGNVAITLDRMPHVGRVPTGPGVGALYATGCNGSGVALNSWMGTRLADVVLGGELPALAEIRFPAVPLHRARRAYLPAVGQWFRWEDGRP